MIDATAAPVCMIAPVSSWAAAVSGVASDLNVDGIQLFVSAIPFNFYSLLTLLFVVVIVVMGFDYGPMAKSEMEAIREGRIGSLGNDEPVVNTRARLWDMLIPVEMCIRDSWWPGWRSRGILFSTTPRHATWPRRDVL